MIWNINLAPNYNLLDIPRNTGSLKNVETNLRGDLLGQNKQKWLYGLISYFDFVSFCLSVCVYLQKTFITPKRFELQRSYSAQIFILISDIFVQNMNKQI